MAISWSYVHSDFSLLWWLYTSLFHFPSFLYKLIKFCQNLAQLKSSQLIFFYIFFIKKTQLFIKIYLSFCICLSAQLSTPLSPKLSTLLSAKLSTWLSAQLCIHLSILVIHPVICQVVRLRQVICPVIHPVICPIILWCLMLPNLTIQVIKLSNGDIQCEWNLDFFIKICLFNPGFY